MRHVFSYEHSLLLEKLYSLHTSPQPIRKRVVSVLFNLMFSFYGGGRGGGYISRQGRAGFLLADSVGGI